MLPVPVAAIFFILFFRSQVNKERIRNPSFLEHTRSGFFFQTSVYYAIQLAVLCALRLETERGIVLRRVLRLDRFFYTEWDCG